MTGVQFKPLPPKNGLIKHYEYTIEHKIRACANLPLDSLNVHTGQFVLTAMHMLQDRSTNTVVLSLFAICVVPHPFSLYKKTQKSIMFLSTKAIKVGQSIVHTIPKKRMWLNNKHF